MHPEIRQDQPGNGPKCGMTLEPVLPAVGEDENKELLDFQRRFYWTLPAFQVDCYRRFDPREAASTLLTYQRDRTLGDV